ncbi:MAG: hypothetical protein IKE31_04110 [Eubacterium sp.]|nr:hypothetical protein [Eubacterium sp.]
MEEQRKINLEELDAIAGGTALTDIADKIKDRIKPGAGSLASAKENMAAVCGMGTVKAAKLASTNNGRTIEAYCPSCKKNTLFYLGSGAQAECSECGEVRLDM